MGKLIIMSGVAGAGKSTWANAYVNEHENTVRVSTDDIRYELFKAYLLPRDQEKIARQVMDARIEQYGKEGKDVIFDVAVVKNKNRIRLYNKYHKFFDEVELVIIDTPLETCLAQNKQRDRFVPEDVIRQMHSWKQEPDAKLKKLFDKVTVIKR